ncbi:hypothetical protein GTCCBUS3UF5_19710 [Geobacillus thermoleovorans CCB_US3_UF5]|uniref:Uncharacterized protein n=1 Tax=Geobacillus thermoleovorans CCB_US3_UF5 TaxID=1111068 RepID=A0ABN4A4E2_GEOTH|nr:hypothetical protein GTCCBUS3UF5_19710 [Geobacillus thermoleovorans CCB_US3_UF5]
MCQGFIPHRCKKILPIFVGRVRNVSYFHFYDVLWMFSLRSFKFTKFGSLAQSIA